MTTTINASTTGGGGLIESADASGVLALQTGGTTAVTIDSSGNLIVGATATSAYFDGIANFAGRIHTKASVSNYFWQTGAGSQTYLTFLSAGTPTQTGSISTNGTITVYNTTSDYRLKNITGEVTGAKDFIMALKPKQGTWKSDGSKFVGFLAHEFQEVSPSSVTGEKDALDADGKPIMQSMQASSSEVIANLVSFVQEQQALITTLQTQITALNAKVGI